MLRPSDSCQSLNGGSMDGMLADGSMRRMRAGLQTSGIVSGSANGASSQAQSLDSLQAVLNGRSGLTSSGLRCEM